MGGLKQEAKPLSTRMKPLMLMNVLKLLGDPAVSCSIPKFENEGRIQRKYLLISNAKGVRFMIEKLY